MSTKLERLRQFIQEQRKFIYECNANKESSYYGENGPAVIDADLQALWYLQTEERRLHQQILENRRIRKETNGS